MLPIFTTQAPPPKSPDSPDLADLPNMPDSSAVAGGNAPAGAGTKVELDLEGAPFLEAEPEEEEAPPPPSGGDKKSPEALPPVRKSRKKLLIIAAIALVLAAAAGAGAFFMLGGGEGGPDAPEVIVVPSTPQVAPGVESSKYNYAWPAFWVEVMDPEGEVRFVVCRLHVATDDPHTAAELGAKSLTIRDAVYYYLSHKPYAFLADNDKLEVIKSDILNIINEYIYSDKKVDEVLLLDYLIK